MESMKKHIILSAVFSYFPFSFLPGWYWRKDLAIGVLDRTLTAEDKKAIVSLTKAQLEMFFQMVFAQPGSAYWLVQNKLRYPDENAIDLLSGRIAVKNAAEAK